MLRVLRMPLHVLRLNQTRITVGNVAILTQTLILDSLFCDTGLPREPRRPCFQPGDGAFQPEYDFSA